jgi:hypothetical protein
MQQESAHVLALQALEWLAGDDELFATFLASTGASVVDLARRAKDEGFLVAILDFLLTDDERVMAFCDRHGLAYTIPMAARVALAGGELENWT